MEKYCKWLEKQKAIRYIKAEGSSSGKSKYINKGPAGAWAIQLKYTDTDKISEWANEGVMFSNLKSYITGYPDGSFGPQLKATRAETAVIITRFLEEQAKPATTGSAITN